MADYDIITYTRPDGESINLSDPPYTTFNYDGFGIGEFQDTTVSPPELDGEYIYDTRMGAKVLTVEFGFSGDGVFERQESRRAIIRLFNPLLGPGTLRLDQVNGWSVEAKCKLSESLPLPSDDFQGVGHYRAIARFKTHGIPGLRDPNINSVAINQAASPGGFTFPWSFPRTFAQSGFFNLTTITNNGDINSPVRISLNGPMISPSFKNLTSGKALTLSSLVLGVGDQLIIDTDPEKYTLQVNGVDVWQYLTDADFWDLLPGANNILFDISGTNVTNTTGTLQWYDYFLGV